VFGTLKIDYFPSTASLIYNQSERKTQCKNGQLCSIHSLFLNGFENQDGVILGLFYFSTAASYFKFDAKLYEVFFKY
jgi:hypothetical protein